jgi:hypothetical protein
MNASWIGLAIAALTAFIGVWKWWAGTERRKTKKKEEIKTEITDAITAKNPSAITGGFDKLNRLK